jgi:MFS family permease
MSEYTLPPATLLIFGFLAGGVQGYAFRRQVPPVRRWIQASSLAGLVAALISILPTGLAANSVGLYAGWAYAWAAYGAVLGVMLQRFFPGRRWMLTSLAGWATAGIVSGAVGCVSDVHRVSGSTELLLLYSASMSQNWAIEGLMVVGAVCGATGGAITGAALLLQSRLPQDREMENAADKKRTNLAGIISGLAAAVLGTFVAPLVVTVLTQGSLDSLDLVIFFLDMAAGTVLCIPTYAVVSIPLGIGGGRIGLEIARASGRTDVRPWIWFGAAVGGVAGYVLSSLVAFAIGQTA